MKKCYADDILGCFEDFLGATDEKQLSSEIPNHSLGAVIAGCLRCIVIKRPLGEVNGNASPPLQGDTTRAIQRRLTCRSVARPRFRDFERLSSLRFSFSACEELSGTIAPYLIRVAMAMILSLPEECSCRRLRAKVPWSVQWSRGPRGTNISSFVKRIKSECKIPQFLPSLAFHAFAIGNSFGVVFLLTGSLRLLKVAKYRFLRRSYRMHTCLMFRLQTPVRLPTPYSRSSLFKPKPTGPAHPSSTARSPLLPISTRRTPDPQS